jgi:hypothetical protein
VLELPCLHDRSDKMDTVAWTPREIGLTELQVFPINASTMTTARLPFAGFSGTHKACRLRVPGSKDHDPRKNLSITLKSLPPNLCARTSRYSSLDVAVSGTATPASSAAATASPKSLSMSDAAKPPP